MPRLYSYCLPVDDGAAPNPFWGTCTLVICKPRIRATARAGDWVAGTGSKFARKADGSTQDLSGRLVYVMKITATMTMEQYDAYTSKHLREKIPDWTNSDRRRRLGDSIYDFARGGTKQRRGVHRSENQATDLSGKNALLSSHFLYFGANAIELPHDLRDIAQNRQGHRVRLNEPYLDRFVSWIESLGEAPCSVLGEPLLDLFESDSCARWCAATRGEADKEDREVLEGNC